MSELTLGDFVNEKGQAKAADAIGVSQGAISKALKNKRDIRVRIDDEGRIDAYEIKPIGKCAT